VNNKPNGNTLYEYEKETVTKAQRQPRKLRDLKAKKDPKGGAYNGNRTGYRPPPGP